MNAPDLSIIIVNWNSRDFVLQCLRTIVANTRSLTYEIIVVDNASFDGLADLLANEFPEVIFIQSSTNLGFAGANNLAFTHSHGRKILFLNPDTEIVGDALYKLAAALEAEPRAGMVGAHLLNSDGSVQTTCITALPTWSNQLVNCDVLRRTFPRWKLWGMQPLSDQSKLPVPVEAISGACMLGERSVLEQVGAFSTDYFMYLEDMDLCRKVKRSGRSIYYVPNACIIHHGGGSSSRRKESNFSSLVLRESLIRYFRIHHGLRYAAAYRFMLIVASMGRLLLLTLALPILLTRREPSLAFRPFGKWWSILLWSLGFSGLTAYRPSSPQLLPSGSGNVSEASIQACPDDASPAANIFPQRAFGESSWPSA